MKGMTLLLALFASSLHAADLAEQLQQCRSVANDLQRLICYDKLDKTMSPVSHQTTTPVTQLSIDSGVSQTKVEETKLTANLDTTSLELKSVQAKDLGLLEFTFTDGQVWRQTSKEILTIKVGDTYSIEQGVLGAFYLKKVGSNRRVRVVREQ